MSDPDGSTITTRRATLRGGSPGRVELIWAAALLAVPGVVAAVAAVRYGWQPLADEGTIVTRAHDVVTSRTPLLGQYSLATIKGGPATHSLGPMLYWLLAIPVRLGPLEAVPLAMVVVNTACLIGTAVLAARWGGRMPLFAVTLGLLVLVRAWGGYQLFSPWNPAAALLPFVALIAVAWAVGCGSHRLLPVVAVLASLCAQCHLTYLLPGLWLSAVAVTAVAAPPLVDRLRRRAPSPDRRERIQALGLTVVAGLVCWAPALIQEVTTEPGNLTLLARSGRAGADTLGYRPGANTVIRVLTGPPVWLRAEGTSLTGYFQLEVPVSGGIQLAAIALVAVLVVLTVRAALRRDRPLAVLGVLTCGLLAVGWVVAAQIPAVRAVVLGYSLWWLSPVGILTWLVVTWGVAREASLLRARRRPGIPAAGPGEEATAGSTTGPSRLVARTSPGVRRVGVGVAGLLLAVLVTVTLPTDEDLRWAFGPTRQIGDAVTAEAEPGQRYLVSFGILHFVMTPAVGYRLREAGADPVLPASLGPATGEGYAARGERCDGIFRLAPVSERVEGARTLTEVVISVPQHPRARYALTVSEDRATSC